MPKALPDMKDPKVREAVWRTIAPAVWSQGLLEYRFHETQKKIYATLQAAKRRKFFLLCSRRMGKSFMLLSLAFKTAIQKPNARVLFLAPTAKHAGEIATDLATELLAECPVNLRPEYKAQSKEFVFKNGSIVRLKGVNSEHAGDLRGGAADLVILDEAGLMDNLKSVVNDVVLPMVMTTDGQIILASTPAESPGHDSAAIYEDLSREGCSVVFTLRDAPHITRETKIEFLVEAGEKREEAADILDGKKDPRTTAAAREFLCWWVSDASKAVVPEFTPSKEREIVRVHTRADFYDAYTSIDPGFEDRTGVLLGWYDFIGGLIVIEDEALLHRANTNEVAKVIHEKEALVFPGHPPYLRISDTDKRLIADLSQLHGLNFAPARKEDSLGAINLLRNDIQAGRLIINPRCTNLTRQLRNAIWNTTASDFARAGSSSPDGHYDLLAALKYMVRMINRTRNPYPDTYYAAGGRFGPPADSWSSPKRRKARSLGLHGDTPLGRRLTKGKKPIE